MKRTCVEFSKFSIQSCRMYLFLLQVADLAARGFGLKNSPFVFASDAPKQADRYRVVLPASGVKPIEIYE